MPLSLNSSSGADADGGKRESRDPSSSTTTDHRDASRPSVFAATTRRVVPPPVSPQRRIADVCVKTIITAAPLLRREVRTRTNTCRSKE